MNPATLRALVVVAALLLGGVLAGIFVRAIKNVEIADLKTAWSAAQAKASNAALSDLAAANLRGDKLAEQLATSENARQTQAEEHQREIRRLTTGRPCLSAAVVRLLNEPAGLARPAGAVSQATGEPVPADGAAATDTDVALWADQARRSYDTCRGRLQAIADFYNQEEAQ